jgi:aminomethyltransferase
MYTLSNVHSYTNNNTHYVYRRGKLKVTTKKRVGLMGMKAPAREHTEIFTPDGATKIGEVTSGTFSPCIKKPIAMG